MGGPPESIFRSGYFTATQNVPVFISITDIVFGFPIWLVTDCGFSDATGLYDLCLNKEMTRLKFVLINASSGQFMYTFQPGNWFPKRQGFQKPSRGIT